MNIEDRTQEATKEIYNNLCTHFNCDNIIVPTFLFNMMYGIIKRALEAQAEETADEMQLDLERD